MATVVLSTLPEHSEKTYEFPLRAMHLAKERNMCPLELIKFGLSVINSPFPACSCVSVSCSPQVSCKWHSEQHQNGKEEACEVSSWWSVLGCTQTKLVEDYSELVTEERRKAKITCSGAWEIQDAYLFKGKRIQYCMLTVHWLLSSALGCRCKKKVQK